MNILYYPGSCRSEGELEKKFRGYDTTVVNAPDGANKRDMLRFYLLRNQFDVIVFDGVEEEIEVIDLAERVVGVVEGSLSPYTRKKNKPKVVIVGHNHNLIRMLNGTHRSVGIRFVEARREDERIVFDRSYQQ